MKKFIPVNNPIITSADKLSVIKALNSGWISSYGKELDKFEYDLGKVCNRKYVSTVSNGTAALDVAIKSLNIKKGSEVIVPAFNIISACLAVINNGLKPILVDSNLDTWNMDSSEIIKKLSKKTKLIILTHIYGYPFYDKKIFKICKDRNIFIIEDAAEMLGNSIENKPCGSLGDISTLSFYANKHITTGEGGAVLTNNLNLYKRMKKIKNLFFGEKNRFNHEDLGFNYRFTNIQAALGLSQIKRIKSIVNLKRKIGTYYYKKLKNVKEITIQKPVLNNKKNIYWIFGIIINLNSKINKKKVVKHLKNAGIETRDFFWPMNKQKVFNNLGYFKNETCPNAEYLSKNGFYIPTGINIKKKEQDYIIKNICSLF